MFEYRRVIWRFPNTGVALFIIFGYRIFHGFFHEIPSSSYWGWLLERKSMEIHYNWGIDEGNSCSLWGVPQTKPSLWTNPCLCSFQRKKHHKTLRYGAYLDMKTSKEILQIYKETRSIVCGAIEFFCAFSRKLGWH